jgi:ketosteroid isomerase-like protein
METLAAETRALREAYDALNRNDQEGFLAVFDPEVERTEPAGFPGEGTFRGIEALRRQVALHRGNWAEGACEVERTMAVGDQIIVFAHVRVRLKDEEGWREGDIADVFRFRDGKATEFRTFASRSEALAWVGVEDPDAV